MYSNGVDDPRACLRPVPASILRAVAVEMYKRLEVVVAMLFATRLELRGSEG